MSYLKGKMIMTFKTNVPDRWIEHPEQLPLKAFHELDNRKSLGHKSMTQGAETTGDLRNSAVKVNNHCASASLSNATFNAASKTRENFRSFGGSKDDIVSSDKS